MLAEVQVGIGSQTVEPETSCGVTISEPCGHQPDLGRTVSADQKIAGHEFPLVADGSRANWIATAVVAGRHEIRSIWTRKSLR